MKHFFKSLIIFIGMIVLGLVGVVLVSYFEQKEKSEEELEIKKVNTIVTTPTIKAEAKIKK